MARFKIIPLDKSLACVEFDGHDPAAALNIVTQRMFTVADVYEEERYLFTLRRNGVEHDFWSITVKAEGVGDPSPA